MGKRPTPTLLSEREIGDYYIFSFSFNNRSPHARRHTGEGGILINAPMDL
jgi:hypothetical protein